MRDPKITYFAVGNGDCSLIALSDNTQILIDCNSTESSRDDDDESRYDVHSHLLKYGKKLDGEIPHIDAFILTHADQDHCRGFETMFYAGDPASYSDKDLKAGRLLIDELWFTPRIFSPHDKDLCVSAEAFRKEATRRMEIHKARAPGRDSPGNRLRIIGYTNNPERKGLDHVTSVPGTYVHVVDGKLKTDFCFFVHAPFKLETDAAWSERNDTSLVLQARFDVEGMADAAFAMFGGDAGATIFEKILERSEDETTLQWDLFMAPHHCSWTYFSEEPYKDNKVPAESSLEIISRGREGARIVASCKPIRDDDDNPPHWAAAELYRSKVGNDRFHVTSETPTEKRPLPLEFSISANGPVLEEASATGAIASSAAVKAAVSTPQTYGKH